MAWTNGRTALFAAALLALANVSCGRESTTEHKARIEWRAMNSWSGHGNTQTDSFDIGYAPIRIRWETKNESPPGMGTFHLTVNSAVSGRELTVAVDRTGVGHGISYINLDPHWAYLVVESKNLDWTVTVEERRAVDNP
ncbi:MAG TPA: hypothetical protein VKX49_05840 [Bryobacteraceae bacterium]|nr:hypothetical protein [Bryobacteraceae bacterium]